MPSPESPKENKPLKTAVELAMEKTDPKNPTSENMPLKTALDIAIERADKIIADKGTVENKDTTKDDGAVENAEIQEASEENKIESLTSLEEARDRLATEYAKYGITETVNLNNIGTEDLKIAEAYNGYKEALAAYRRERWAEASKTFSNEAIVEKELSILKKDAENAILRDTVALEAAKLYDLRVEKRIEGTAYGKIKKLLGKTIDGYRKLGWKKKIAVGAGLTAIGVLGGVAGSAGLISLAVAGKLATRSLSSAGMATGVEGALHARQQKKEIKEVQTELADALIGGLDNINADLDRKLLELEGRQTREFVKRSVAGAAVGATTFFAFPALTRYLGEHISSYFGSGGGVAHGSGVVQPEVAHTEAVQPEAVQPHEPSASVPAPPPAPEAASATSTASYVHGEHLTNEVTEKATNTEATPTEAHHTIDTDTPTATESDVPYGPEEPLPEVAEVEAFRSQVREAIRSELGRGPGWLTGKSPNEGVLRSGFQRLAESYGLNDVEAKHFVDQLAGGDGKFSKADFKDLLGDGDKHNINLDALRDRVESFKSVVMRMENVMTEYFARPDGVFEKGGRITLKDLESLDAKRFGELKHSVGLLLQQAIGGRKQSDKPIIESLQFLNDQLNKINAAK